MQKESWQRWSPRQRRPAGKPHGPSPRDLALPPTGGEGLAFIAKLCFQREKPRVSGEICEGDEAGTEKAGGESVIHLSYRIAFAGALIKEIFCVRNCLAQP